jgi:hypothetical protein
LFSITFHKKCGEQFKVSVFSDKKDLPLHHNYLEKVIISVALVLVAWNLSEKTSYAPSEAGVTGPVISGLFTTFRRHVGDISHFPLPTFLASSALSTF